MAGDRKRDGVLMFAVAADREAARAERAREELPRPMPPPPITAITLTLTPPVGWTDAEYDAALAALRELDLKGELLGIARLHAGSRTALEGVRVTARDPGD